MDKLTTQLPWPHKYIEDDLLMSVESAQFGFLPPFLDLDGCIGSFLWQGSPPRLAKPTLQLSVSCGGLALPSLMVYNWASIIVPVRWWFQQSRTNAAVCLEGTILGSFGELSNLVYRGPKAYPSLPDPTKATL